MTDEVHAVKKRIAGVPQQAVRMLAGAAACDAAKRHRKIQFRQHEFDAQRTSRNPPGKPITGARRESGHAQNLIRTKDRAGYDLVCFSRMDFKALIEPRGKSICLRPGREPTKFLLDTWPWTTFRGAAHHRGVAPIFCREREPALHIRPDSLKTRCTRTQGYFIPKLRYGSHKSFRKYTASLKTLHSDWPWQYHFPNLAINWRPLVPFLLCREQYRQS